MWVQFDDQGRTFRIIYPTAREVHVVGDFNRWAIPGIPLDTDGNGAWKVRLELPPGRYRYRFYAIESYLCTTESPWGRITWLTNVETVEVMGPNPAKKPGKEFLIGHATVESDRGS